MGEKKLNDDYYIRAYFLQFNYYFMKKEQKIVNFFYDFSFGLLTLSFSLVTWRLLMYWKSNH